MKTLTAILLLTATTISFAQEISAEEYKKRFFGNFAKMATVVEGDSWEVRESFNANDCRYSYIEKNQVIRNTPSGYYILTETRSEPHTECFLDMEHSLIKYYPKDGKLNISSLVIPNQAQSIQVLSDSIFNVKTEDFETVVDSILPIYRMELKTVGVDYERILNYEGVKPVVLSENATPLCVQVQISNGMGREICEEVSPAIFFDENI
jgi:hypothetical protein